MLSKNSRLRSERDYARLFAKGKNVNGKGVGMKFLRLPVGSGVRIGFVVSTKVSKRANVRNLIKRRMRVAVKPYLPTLTDIDIAFMARSESKDMTYAQIVDSMKAVLEKSGVLGQSVNS